MSAQQVADAPAELTVDELAAAAGIPVRRIRFYAGKKLLPPPRLDGRTGLYNDGHLARLQLIAELQEAGYTLAAIEDFLAALPDDADSSTVALFGTLLAPAGAGAEVVMTRGEFRDRLGIALTDGDVDRLMAANLVTDAGPHDDDMVSLTSSQLEFTLRMLSAGAPVDVLIEAGDVVQAHARRLAEDLQDVFRRGVIEQYEDPTPEERQQMRALASALRPLTIQAIVTAYQKALHDVVRDQRG